MGGRRRSAALNSDRAARSDYFADRVQRFLYGSDTAARSPSDGTRLHRWVEQPEPDEHGSAIEAWELLTLESSTYAVAHVRLGADPAAALAALTVRNGPGRDHLERSLGPQIPLAGKRPTALTHLLWSGEQFPEPGTTSEPPAALARWTRTQRWLWYLASGLGSSDYLPDVEAPIFEGGTVWLSASWRALVLRDGVAYVALTPKVPGQVEFHDFARVYVRSIHLDAILLGILQGEVIRQFADRLGAIQATDLNVVDVRRLEADFMHLRGGLWWRDVTQAGGQVSTILGTFQDQHRLPALHRQINDDLGDVARYVAAASAAADEAVREARTERDRRVELVIGWVSFILLPSGVVFGAAALVADPSPHLLLYSVLVGVVLIALPVLLLRPLREAVWRRSK